jgi:hypothetical protein
MSYETISIFGNKIFSEILSEIKIFSKYSIKYYDELSLCVKDAENKHQLVVFFANELNQSSFIDIQKNKFPLILIGDSFVLKKISYKNFNNKLNIPFTILDFKKKVITAIAINEYQKNSLVILSDYIIDKNERKIKKNNLELKLSEKEINFLVLFTKNKDPISKKFVLKKVWNYSLESETHTVETHIHRLRKKILQKFDDNNFIKNNKKGYYI